MSARTVRIGRTPQHLLDERYGPSSWWVTRKSPVVCMGCDREVVSEDEPCPWCRRDREGDAA